MLDIFRRIKRAFRSSETVEEGEKIPDFELENQEGRTLNSDEISDALIYFYPKSGTSGCTKEACSIHDRINDFNDLGVEVYGVSTDTVEKQKRFHDEQELNFDLLADPEGEVVEKFGVLTKSGFAERTSFVVKDGKIDRIFRKVDPEDHVDEVLSYLK